MQWGMLPSNRARFSPAHPSTDPPQGPLGALENLNYDPWGPPRFLKGTDFQAGLVNTHLQVFLMYLCCCSLSSLHHEGLVPTGEGIS